MGVSAHLSSYPNRRFFGYKVKISFVVVFLFIVFFVLPNGAHCSVGFATLQSTFDKTYTGPAR